jgi:hypothetical protein
MRTTEKADWLAEPVAEALIITDPSAYNRTSAPARAAPDRIGRRDQFNLPIAAARRRDRTEKLILFSRLRRLAVTAALAKHVMATA